MKEENKISNCGVCCDVGDCTHNLDGCNCDMTTIKVSKGHNDKHHFCKSYCCKE